MRCTHRARLSTDLDTIQNIANWCRETDQLRLATRQASAPSSFPFSVQASALQTRPTPETMSCHSFRKFSPLLREAILPIPANSWRTYFCSYQVASRDISPEKSPRSLSAPLSRTEQKSGAFPTLSLMLECAARIFAQMLAQKIGVAHPAINVLVGAPERAHEKTRIENAPRDYHVDALPYPAFSLEISGFY